MSRHRSPDPPVRRYAPWITTTTLAAALTLGAVAAATAFAATVAPEAHAEPSAAPPTATERTPFTAQTLPPLNVSTPAVTTSEQTATVATPSAAPGAFQGVSEVPEPPQTAPEGTTEAAATTSAETTTPPATTTTATTTAAPPATTTTEQPVTLTPTITTPTITTTETTTATTTSPRKRRR